jgi:ribonuclease HII
VLGTAANESVVNLTDAWLDADGRRGIGIIHEALASGTDARQFCRQMVAHLRELLLLQAAGNDLSLDVPQELQATMLAMRRAVLGLLGPASGATPYGSVRVEVDGNRLPSFEGVAGIAEAVAIVKGDATQPAISAASILAKTARDHVMEQLDTRHPEYGFAIHKGYPTPAHLAALKAHGPSSVHRRSFGPVKSAAR